MLIYYSKDYERADNKFNFADIIRTDVDVLYDCIKDNPNLQHYLKCPAATRELKRTLVVYSDIDYIFTVSGCRAVSPVRDQSYFDNLIEVHNNEGDRNCFQLACHTNLFTEADTEATSLPPYLHTSPINGLKFLPGTFNISKWFRPFQLSFYYDETKEYTINLRRGTPLHYIRINTSEKINLKSFCMTEKLLNYMANCTGVKDHLTRKNLNYLYNMFTQKNYNRKILTAIKESVKENG